VILVNERIEEQMKKAVSTAILNFTFAQKKSLVVLIDCTGGDVEIAMQLYDIIRSSPSESVGIVIGECSSSAMLLLQACGVRAALPNARFMCHTLCFTQNEDIRG
jgi:ATP-dependent protease ClpP protease subunit